MSNFFLSSLLSGEDMSFLLMWDGAWKWRFRLFLLEELTAGLNFIAIGRLTGFTWNPDLARGPGVEDDGGRESRGFFCSGPTKFFFPKSPLLAPIKFNPEIATFFAHIIT